MNPLADNLVEDMTQNGLACDIQQNFGKCEGMRTQPASDAGDWYDGAHLEKVLGVHFPQVNLLRSKVTNKL
jgi:hypothetical protein